MPLVFGGKIPALTIQLTQWPVDDSHSHNPAQCKVLEAGDAKKDPLPSRGELPSPGVIKL